MHEDRHQFDWYQATVPAHHSLLVRELLANAPDGVAARPGKGRNCYAASISLVMPDDEVVSTVLHGGPNGNPNVLSTSDNAPALAHLLRELFPAHRVTRLDVAIDMQADGLFDDVVRLMSAIGREYRLKGEKIIPDDLDDGSTYYLGSRTSPLRVRCYEKGKQLLKLTGDPVWRNFFNWTRLELQVRPEKDFKSEAATMEAPAFWGCSGWTRELANGVFRMNPPTVAMKPTRIADQDRAMRALYAQYGQTMLRQVRRLGGWEAFLDEMRTQLEPDHAQAA